MRQKIPTLFISLLAAIFFANAINKALPMEPQKPAAPLASAAQAGDRHTLPAQ